VRDECCNKTVFIRCKDCPLREEAQASSSPLPTDNGDILRERKNELAVRSAIETILVIRQNDGSLVGYTVYTAMQIIDKLKALKVLKLDGDEIEASDCGFGQPSQPGPEQGPGGGQPEVGGRQADGIERAFKGAVSQIVQEVQRDRQAGDPARLFFPSPRPRGVEAPGAPSAEPSTDVLANTAGRKYVPPAPASFGPEPSAERSSDEGKDEGGPEIRSAAQRLRGLAELREQRQRIYGDHFLGKGALLLALFPEGLVLRTEEDFTRAANLFQTIDKMARYCVNFTNGGHPDSLDDLSVYSQIQAYIDEVTK